MKKALVGCVVTFALIATALAALTLLSATSTPTFAAGGGCVCPMIYAPVKCDNGRTYTNGCFASCAHATNCVPVGPGPIQL